MYKRIILDTSDARDTCDTGALFSNGLPALPEFHPRPCAAAALLLTY